MIKQISVTFEFDPETQFVSNLNCFVDGIEKKKPAATRKKKNTELEPEALVIREANRLVFNNKCYLDMALSTEDRIIIKYEKVNNKRIPIIGTDSSFNEEGSGNKVTKAQTTSYRGKVNTVLAEYGETFRIKPYSEGLWELVSNENPDEKTYDTIVEKAEKLDVEITTTDDEKIEIDELTFTL